MSYLSSKVESIFEVDNKHIILEDLPDKESLSLESLRQEALTVKQYVSNTKQLSSLEEDMLRFSRVKRIPEISLSSEDGEKVRHMLKQILSFSILVYKELFLHKLGKIRDLTIPTEMDNIESLTRQVTSVTDLQDRLSKVETDLLCLQEESNAIKKDLLEFKTCPLCGHEFEGQEALKDTCGG